jgi:hypothetical protein
MSAVRAGVKNKAMTKAAMAMPKAMAKPSHVDLLRVLTQDPSVARRPASATHAALEERMLQLLAGHEAPRPH